MHELLTYGTPDSLTLLEWASIFCVFATVNLIKVQIKIILKEIKYKTGKDFICSKVFISPLFG